MNTQSFKSVFTTAVVRYPSGTWGVVPADAAVRAEQQGRCRVRYMCTRDEAHVCMERITASMRKDHTARAERAVPSTESSVPSAEIEELRAEIERLKAVVSARESQHASDGANWRVLGGQVRNIHKILTTARKGSREHTQALDAIAHLAGVCARK